MGSGNKKKKMRYPLHASIEGVRTRDEHVNAISANGADQNGGNNSEEKAGIGKGQGHC